MMRGKEFNYNPLNYRTNVLHAPRTITREELEKMKKNAVKDE